MYGGIVGGSPRLGWRWAFALESVAMLPVVMFCSARNAERDAQVETREPRGFLTGRGEIVYERRGESAEGRFADSHESPREKERFVIRREGARHRGDGPRAEADGDEAKGVRALGE